MTIELMNMDEQQRELFQRYLDVNNKVAQKNGMPIPDIRLIRGAYNLTVMAVE